jgi:hypothetical protein
MDESAVFHDQLLATKFFIPSSLHALIPRLRLIELLNLLYPYLQIRRGASFHSGFF